MDRERIFSATDAIGFGWAETKQRFTSLFFGLGVLTLMLGALEGSAQRHGQGLLHLLLQLASMLVTMGWWRIALRLHDGQGASLDALREVTLVRALHYGLTIFLFWAATIVGLVLLVLPGIVLGARLALAPVIVVDEGRDPVAALHRSWELTEGQLVPMLTLGLMLFGLNLLGALALGLGLLATMPITFLAVTHVYRRLQHAADDAGTYREAPTAA